jgi:hypothetical protein
MVAPKKCSVPTFSILTTNDNGGLVHKEYVQGCTDIRLVVLPLPLCKLICYENYTGNVASSISAQKNAHEEASFA